MHILSYRCSSFRINIPTGANPMSAEKLSERFTYALDESRRPDGPYWPIRDLCFDNEDAILSALRVFEAAPATIREAVAEEQGALDKIDDLLERHQGAMTKSQYAAAANEIRALIDEAVAKGRDLENEGCAVLVESAAGNNLGNLMTAFDFEDYLKPNLQALLAAISASIRAWSAKQLALVSRNSGNG